MARFLLCPLGSHGDVHPFIAIGNELKARGHDVHLITSEHFRPLAEHAGFEFAPIGTEADFQALIRDPDLWHPSRSMRAIYGNYGWVSKVLREGYGHIAERYRPGETVAACGILGFGGRLAQEKLGVPLATLNLQPGALFSVEKPPVYPTLRMRPWWPRWMRRLAFWTADHIFIDRLAGPPLNEFRCELGLPPVRRIIGRWVHSPDLMLNLFPDWFGSAPDWPPQCVNTGFIRFDQAEQPLPEAIEKFLSNGEPPLVWTFGSAMRQGEAFFAAAVDACVKLGRRGLLLCRGREQVPTSLPPGVMHADYAPFSVVFPRAAAVIHHGGIGTTAQALAAGVPQMIVPLAFDQPDNADRIVKLNAGTSLPRQRFNGTNAAKVLEEMLASDGIRQFCRELAGRIVNDHALENTCDRMEQLLAARPQKESGHALTNRAN